MLYRQLDAALKKAATDIVTWNDSVVVTTYDNCISIYTEGARAKRIRVPSVTHRLASNESFLVALSPEGNGYLVDKGLQIVATFRAIESASSICITSEYILVSSWAYAIALYKIVYSDGKPEVVPVWIKKCSKRGSALKVRGKKVAVALENVLVILDLDGREILRKTLLCNISALELTDSGIFIGMCNGKIHFEHFSKKEETFVFNDHFEIQGEYKVFYPVTALHYNTLLTSSGYDGRISQWDVSNKRYIGSLCKSDGHVINFVLQKGNIFAIVDGAIKNVSNTVIYASVE